MSQENLLKMAQASIEAGVSITLAGTSIPHGMSYPITYNFGVPHGLACAEFLPDYLRICEETTVHKLLAALGYESVEKLESVISEFVTKKALTNDQKEDFTSALFSSGKLKAHGPVERDVILKMW